MATVKSADDGSNVGKKPSKLLQINWWYGLDSWESERKLHLHQMQSNSFFLSKFLLLAIVTYIVLLNWSHIFYSVRFDDSVYVNFFLTVPLTAFFCIFVTALHALIPPEMIVHDRFVQLMMYLMALWIVIAFNGVQSLLTRFDLCSPMRMVADIDCSDGFYFPVELVVIELFLPVLIQHAFPNFGWVPLLAMYLVVFVLVLTFAAYSGAVESAPLLIVSTIYSLGSLFTLRSEALKSYQLSLDVEERRSIEQEATLGQRLRTMISGVAHDLKSPLSALALGLESVKQLSQQAQQQTKQQQQLQKARGQVCPEAERVQNEANEYNNIIEWMEATKDAMATIISRCVDVNQALSGVPLTPTYGLVHLNEEVNTVIQFYREESPQAQITVRWEPHLPAQESLPADCWSNVVTDRVWFVQSLMCFVGNAVKFCDYSSQRRHEVDVSITLVDTAAVPGVSCDSMSMKTMRSNLKRKVSRLPSTPTPPTVHTKFIRVEVHDCGVGVAPEVRPALFTFSGHRLTQMQVGGTGLGLYTMANRIVALGGRFGYSPRYLPTGEEKGSMFWFEVPYDRDVFVEGMDPHRGGRLQQQGGHHHHPPHGTHSNGGSPHRVKTSRGPTTTTPTIGAVAAASSSSIGSSGLDSAFDGASDHDKLVRSQQLLLQSSGEDSTDLVPDSFSTIQPIKPIHVPPLRQSPSKRGITPTLPASMDLDDHGTTATAQRRAMTIDPSSRPPSFVTSLDSQGTTGHDAAMASGVVTNSHSASLKVAVDDRSVVSLATSDHPTVTLTDAWALSHEPGAIIEEQPGASTVVDDGVLPSTAPPSMKLPLVDEVPGGGGGEGGGTPPSAMLKAVVDKERGLGQRKVSFSALPQTVAASTVPPLPLSTMTPAAEDQSSPSTTSGTAASTTARDRTTSENDAMSVMSVVTPRRMQEEQQRQLLGIPSAASGGGGDDGKQASYDDLTGGDGSMKGSVNGSVTGSVNGSVNGSGKIFTVSSRCETPGAAADATVVKTTIDAMGGGGAAAPAAASSATGARVTATAATVAAAAAAQCEKQQQVLLRRGFTLVGHQFSTNLASVAHSQVVALQLPVIAMSASSDGAIIAQAIAAGMSHFIAKPFQMQQFDTIISELMY
eukprot:gene9405-6735_t